MKKIILFFVLLCGLQSFSQTPDSIPVHSMTTQISNAKTAINIGVLMGGGSLTGTDFEIMLLHRIGIQAGIGIASFGAGINYHLKPQITSSFISLQYWK